MLVLGFHIYFDDLVLDPNIKQWKVTPYKVRDHPPACFLCCLMCDGAIVCGGARLVRSSDIKIEVWYQHTPALT